MKRQIKVGLLIMMIAVCLAGCGSTAGNTKEGMDSELFGTWSWKIDSQNGVTYYYEFKEDGTGCLGQMEDQSVKIPFTYEVKDKEILITKEASSGDGETTNSVGYEVDGDTLVLTAESGKVTTLQKQ